MASRINRAIELLQQDQAIYYTGGHSGHVLTYAQGCDDALTWADYINVGMEHGAFDMTGFAEYMRGLVEGGPTRSGHRTPADYRRGAGQRHRHGQCPLQRLAIPPNPRARRARHSVVPGRVGRCRPRLCRSLPLPAPIGRGRPGSPFPGRADERRERESGRRPPRHRHARPRLGSDCRPDLGDFRRGIFRRCDPWPLNPEGELLLGVKLESPEGIAHCEEILTVPGLGFAELGPGDLGLALGYVAVPRDPYPPEMKQARERVFAACREGRVPFLETGTPENIAAKLDEGVRVIAGHREETARVGRAYQRRTMPV